MKALEQRVMLESYGADRNYRLHQEKLKNVRNVVNTRNEAAVVKKQTNSPSKRKMTENKQKEHITKENLKLAQKIFNIMEGKGSIAATIEDTSHADKHPGTMNFRRRLKEAQRIHDSNMLLASRLDTIEPHYRKADLSIVVPTKTRAVTSEGKRKSTFKKELDAVLDGKSNQTKIAKFTKTIHKDNNSTEKSPRFSADSAAERSKKKPQNVLLEYTKIQDGRVLDIAVIKEPFRDRYAIFGIDVDDGQRYELRLSSEEVSTTLDGDILVTSVDNVEVWMVLLNKVYLNKVAAFTKMPYTSEEVDLARPSTSRSSHKNDRPSSFQRPSTEEINSYVSRNGLYEKWTSNELLSQRSVDTEGDTPVVPSRPTTERPSTSRASHSRGASYIEDGQKNIVGDSLSIDTQSVYDENKGHDLPGDSTSVLASYRAGADSFDTIDSLNVAGMDNDGLEKTVRMVATTKDIYMDIGVVAESIDVDDLAPIPENKILPELLPTVKSKDDIDTASGSGKVTVVVNNSKQAEQPVKEDEVLAPVRVKPHSAEEASAPKQKETKAPERTAKPVSAKPQPPVNKPTKVETVEAKSTVSAKPTGSKQQVVDGIAKSSDAKISEAENKSKTTAKAESVLTKSKEETKPTVKVQPVKAASKASTSANSSVSSESVNGTRRISVQKVAKPANSSTRSVSKSSEVRKSFNKKVDSVSKAEDGKIADKMVKPIVEEYIHIATNTVQGAIENAVVKISQSRRSSERSEATDKVENEKESESLVPNTSKYDKSQNKSQSKLMHNDKIEEPNETESVNISLKRESKSEEDKEDEDGEDIYGDIDFNNDLEEEADKMIAKLGTSTSDGVIEEIEE